MRTVRDTAPAGYLRPMLQGAMRLRYALLVGLWGALAIWFWAWWLQPGHVIGWGRFALVTACLVWIFFLQAYFIAMFLRARQPVASLDDLGPCRIAMVVTKTPGEPFSILRETLQAMLAQDVPHDTWLADEAPDDFTRAWCAGHGVRISTRQGIEAYHRPVWPRRTRCKEGNLAYFYDHYGYDRYDIVSQLDADHVPQPGYLREILRPFADPSVGYVSAPSICSRNAHQSWAARTRLHAEAMFHGVLQAGYSNGWAPMCIGSHYAVRTRALKAVGGLGPELAEDHSTSMILNAGGWRGVHAIDAIARGDGPASITDMVTQEFQWSRSLLTLLLQYTPRYFAALPARQKFQFVFSQLWYPLFALFMALMYALPIVALAFDTRFADVSYLGFLGHVLPALITLVVLAYMIRADGLFRPRDAKVLGWEKAFFAAAQWPWVLWGCVMALRDRITGRFVDFRVTPKGRRAADPLPWSVLLPYLGLALGAVLPVLLVDDPGEAAGFYIFACVNAAIYTSLLLIIVMNHLRENGIPLRGAQASARGQIACVMLLGGLIVTSMMERGADGFIALATTTGPTQMVETRYMVSGAGQGPPGTVKSTFSSDWRKIIAAVRQSQRD